MHCFAPFREGVEVQVVEQVHAHRVDREHVHGEVHALDGARRRVIVAIAAKDRDPAFREQLERRRVQSTSTPSYSSPSKITWHSASMWLSALP
jgi:predicted TIM-barrel fold metal-dependent hydrolase